MHGGTTDLLLIGNWVKNHPTSSYANVLVQFLDTNGDGKVGLEDKLPPVRIFLVNPLNPDDKFEDPDSDGLNNYQEFLNNTDPLSWDTDGDHLPDGWEIKHSKKNLDPTRADTDGDYIPDDDDGDGNFDVVEEIINGIDDDGDGLIDEEYDPNDANEDLDHDGMIYYMWNKTDGEWKYTQFYHPFSNYYEYYWGWSTDEDAYHEITTNPNEADSDGDNMPDGWEIWVSDYFNPADVYNKSKYDDNDGLAKGWEDLFNGSLGLFPLDYVPKFLTLSPSEQEAYRGRLDSTKYKTATDVNAKYDGAEDIDGDGANNSMEYKYHTDPTDADSSPAKIGIPIHGARGAEVQEDQSSDIIIPDPATTDLLFCYSEEHVSPVVNEMEMIMDQPAVIVSRERLLRDD